MMDVECLAASCKLCNTDRIETAGNRLAEIALAFQEFHLDRAETVPVLVEMTESTFLGAFGKRGYNVPFEVDLEESLRIHGSASFRLHEGRAYWIYPFKFVELVFFQRSSTFSNDAAFAATLLVIAAETLHEYVLGNQYVSDLNYCAESSLMSHE